MNRIISISGAAVLASFLPAAMAVGIEAGTVLAYDRKAQVLVLNDRSLWSLAQAESGELDRLSAGDRVQFSHRTRDDGTGVILEISIIREPVEEGMRRSVNGTVAAHDRKAQVLILDDKSLWSLDKIDAGLLGAIEVGNRVRIEYEVDREGVSAIRDIRVIAY